MPIPFFPNYIDLSQPDGIPRLIEAPGIPNPITTIRRKRGTAPAQGVQFIRNGVPVDPGAITLTFMVKEVGKYDGAALVSGTGAAWTAPAVPGDFYTGAPTYNTTAVNTALLSPDGNPNNDIPKKSFICAFSWRIGAGAPTETEEVELVLLNKVVNGDEADPVLAGPDLDARTTTLEVALGLASGRLKINAASIVSGPAEWLAGAIYSGGTGTTTFPHLLVQPSTATPATTWSTAGTVFGINTASGFGGKFLDFRVNGGASLFSVSYFGGLIASGATFSGAVTCGGAVTVGTYTVTTLPSASGSAGAMIFVSNESGGAVLAFCDGTNWRRVTDRAIVS